MGGGAGGISETNRQAGWTMIRVRGREKDLKNDWFMS